MASRVENLISCMCGARVKGLNKRFCIRVPDSVRPWGRGSRRRCGGIRWLLLHRVAIKTQHRPLPEGSQQERRCRTRRR